MAGIQYAGEYEIEELTLKASSGQMINFLEEPFDNVVQQLIIYENIFSPDMTGQITLLDVDSLVLNMPIIGQEYLKFKIKTASFGEEKEGIIDYTKHAMYIYKIDSRFMVDNVELISLHFTSLERMRDSRTKVSKSYTNSIDKIVIDVLQNKKYINSKKDLFIDKTVGTRKIIAPNSSPFTFIQKLATESISAKNKGSPYFMFFENKDGIHFRSLNNLYEQPVIAEYNTGKFSHQEDSGTVVTDVLDEYGRPISHEIPPSLDMLGNIIGGMVGSKLITHDIYKKNYKIKDYRYLRDFDEYGRLSPNPIYNNNRVDDTDQPVDNFTNASIHLHPTSKVGENDAQHYTDAVDRLRFEDMTATYAPNGIEKSLLHRRGKFKELQSGVSLVLLVHGMTNITVGQTINFEMLVVGKSHGKKKADPYYTGKYLITQLRHEFNISKKHQELALTIVKDGYGEKLEQKFDAKEDTLPLGTIHWDA